MDTSSSTGHRNGADLVVWTAGNTRSLGPVPLHTSGRRFDTVRPTIVEAAAIRSVPVA